MSTRTLGNTGLNIVPIVFGGNVFGWTVDEATSFQLLDAFVEAGFNTIDTADVYSNWAPGNQGGESETIIGNWLANRPGMRERVVLCTKVGYDRGTPRKMGLSPAWIRSAVEASLTRLRTDRIDLYFSHLPDPAVPVEDTLGAYQDLIQAGKVRSIGVSNSDAAGLADALAVADRHGLPRYQALQPEYNLYTRDTFEGALQNLCIAEDIGVVTYYALASGFLSGKYRSTADLGQGARSRAVARYLTPRGTALLDALHDVADRHRVSAAAVALAWQLTRPGVTAPIASATSLAQLAAFSEARQLSLDDRDVARLNDADA